MVVIESDEDEPPRKLPWATIAISTGIVIAGLVYGLRNRPAKAPPPEPVVAEAPPSEVVAADAAAPEAAGGEAATQPPPPPPPPPAPEAKDGQPMDRGQTELTATAPPRP